MSTKTARCDRCGFTVEIDVDKTEHIYSFEHDVWRSQCKELTATGPASCIYFLRSYENRLNKK